MTNLEHLTQQLERLEQEKLTKYKEYTEKIQETQLNRAKTDEEYEREIKAIEYLILEELGDQDESETDSFVVSKVPPNLKSRNTYKLHFPKTKEEKARFERYMKEEHPELIKEETVIKPIQNDIKQLIIEGVYHVTNEGLLIDDNGMAIPYTTADVKGVGVKVKVKK